MYCVIFAYSNVLKYQKYVRFHESFVGNSLLNMICYSKILHTSKEDVYARTAVIPR